MKLNSNKISNLELSLAFDKSTKIWRTNNKLDFASPQVLKMTAKFQIWSGDIFWIFGRQEVAILFSKCPLCAPDFSSHFFGCLHTPAKQDSPPTSRTTLAPTEQPDTSLLRNVRGRDGRGSKLRTPQERKWVGLMLKSLTRTQTQTCLGW